MANAAGANAEKLAEAAGRMEQAAMMAEELVEPMRLQRQFPNLPSIGHCHRGRLNDGQPHGLGVYRWEDGSVYHGELQYGDRHGLGVQRHANGITHYAGKWNRNTKHLGVFKSNDGRLLHSGFFHHDKPL
eukprot:GHVU01229146.1.p1 GENE.GHVU01229146.1~~GHVU01229146.1.p1  ORF type:complete len:130 (+),score=21.10 GHVU01229146.1:625-1014(+)